MPDGAWYDTFYSTVEKSRVYDAFCQKTYHMDFSQQGFSDMEQINFMLDKTRLKPGQRVLDIGCGNGKMIEYIADRYGVLGEGFDISGIAIDAAARRTRGKADKLKFRPGSINGIQYDKNSFDTVLSVDTLYFAEDLKETVLDILAWIKPLGCLAVFYSEFRFTNLDPLEMLTKDGTALAQALHENGIAYTVFDFTKSHYEVMRRKRSILLKLKQAFEEEGAHMLYDNTFTESIDEEVSFEDFRSFSARYLYLVYKEHQVI
jgi:cyclopropane fatty-acyl-phospholipid synthase-like methyltransferase